MIEVERYETWADEHLSKGGTYHEIEASKCFSQVIRLAFDEATLNRCIEKLDLYISEHSNCNQNIIKAKGWAEEKKLELNK